jgi:hypothetical protein
MTPRIPLSALASFALLASGCAQTPSRPARAADDYAAAFAASAPGILAGAIELTAGRIDLDDAHHVSLGGHAAYPVRARTLDPEQWDGVASLQARVAPGADAPSGAALESALAQGVSAERAEIRAGRASLAVRLWGVAFAGVPGRAEWLDVTLRYEPATVATKAAVATAGPLNGAASVTRLSGD